MADTRWQMVSQRGEQQRVKHHPHHQQKMPVRGAQANQTLEAGQVASESHLCSDHGEKRQTTQNVKTVQSREDVEERAVRAGRHKDPLLDQLTPAGELTPPQAPFGPGLSVSADGRWLRSTQERDESDLMLAEPFR